jgi:hypothetical protein
MSVILYDVASSLTAPIIGGVLAFIVAAITAVVILMVIVYLMGRYVLTVTTYGNQ